MININDFIGKSDNEIIENAISNKDADGVVVITPKKDGKAWLLDRAILLPSNTTVVLKNCKLKLSDKCRDNFFRSANCGMGKGDPEKLTNIHIIGEGLSVLEGADHPRATGDSSKTLHNPCPHDEKDLLLYVDWLSEEEKKSGKISFWSIHNHSYGTDCDKEGENKKGDWRGIGILLANVDNFSVENITIKESHGWGISLEACRYGRVEKINFDAKMYKYIDGMKSNMENQDGIDVRNGCSDIIISDITGETGDDVIALTAIAHPSEYKGGGYSTHVMHEDWSRRESGIKNIIIKNVIARSYLCWVIRLLAVETVIENIVIDNVIDNSENEIGGGFVFGARDGAYGSVYPDSIKNVTISNVIVNKKEAILLDGYLSDSAINGLINRYIGGEIIKVNRENGLKNVKIL